jgi:hypothetical protein
MERDVYNLVNQECVSTLSGPVCKCIKTEFLGENIYKMKIRSPDNCDERHTYLDCKGNVKYTLPLEDYIYLRKNKNNFHFSNGT